MAYSDLMREAKRLGAFAETEQAGAMSDEYDAFAALIEDEYRAGRMIAYEFNMLAATAFYDYPYLRKGDKK